MSDAATEINDSRSSTPFSFSKSLDAWRSPSLSSIGLEAFDPNVEFPSRPGSPTFSSPLLPRTPVPSQSVGDASTSVGPETFEFRSPLRTSFKSPMERKERLEDVVKMLGPEIDMKQPFKIRTRSELLVYQKLRAMMDEMAATDDATSPGKESDSLQPKLAHPGPSFESLSLFLQTTGDHSFVDMALTRLDFRCLMALDPMLALRQLRKRRRLITLLCIGALFDRESMYLSGPYSLFHINNFIYIFWMRTPFTKDHDLRARVVYHVGTALIHVVCARYKHEVLDWRLRHLRRGNAVAVVLCVLIVGYLVRACFQYSMLAEYRVDWRERWDRRAERSLIRMVFEDYGVILWVMFEIHFMDSLQEVILPVHQEPQSEVNTGGP